MYVRIHDLLTVCQKFQQVNKIIWEKLERASERSEEEEVYTNFDLHVYFSGGSIDAILVANKVMMTK